MFDVSVNRFSFARDYDRSVWQICTINKRQKRNGKTPIEEERGEKLNDKWLTTFSLSTFFAPLFFDKHIANCQVDKWPLSSCGIRHQLNPPTRKERRLFLLPDVIGCRWWKNCSLALALSKSYIITSAFFALHSFTLYLSLLFSILFSRSPFFFGCRRWQRHFLTDWNHTEAKQAYK